MEPCLVAEIEFREWTREGVMRAPSYKGLRDDKEPRDVMREPAPLPGQEGDLAAGQDDAGHRPELARPHLDASLRYEDGELGTGDIPPNGLA